MATFCLYDNDSDKKLHFRAIQMLANEFSIPEGEVQALYEMMLGSLKETARVKDFLAILVSRNVKDRIMRGTRSQT